jgi:hypothetical protein
MRRWALTARLAASVLLCAAGAAHAQGVITRGLHEPARVTTIDPNAPKPEPEPAPPDASATEVDALTVEAARASPQVVEKQSRAFVLTYAKPTEKLDQIARWRDAVCVVVEGAVAPEMAANIKARITGVARTLGVRVVKSRCTANIEILFSARPQYWLDWIANHHDSALGLHSVPQTKALKTVVRSIQAWYVTSTRCDGITTAAALKFGGINGFSTRDETYDSYEGSSPVGCGDSRVTSGLESVFSNVLVFVDSGRLSQPELGPIGDYLTMVTLSQPRTLDGCNALPSVIDFYAVTCPGRQPPDKLTRTDMAYLKALYSADPEAKKASEMTDIAGRMAASLIKEASASPAAGR